MIRSSSIPWVIKVFLGSLGSSYVDYNLVALVAGE